MISFRLTQGDTAVRRYFQAERDGEPVSLVSASCLFRKPSGEVVSGVGAIEDSSAGEFYIEFGSADLLLDEAGQHWLEVSVNGEHGEEPLEIWVRPLYVEGPR
jgi:hypothetical protein